MTSIYPEGMPFSLRYMLEIKELAKDVAQERINDAKLYAIDIAELEQAVKENKSTEEILEISSNVHSKMVEQGFEGSAGPQAVDVYIPSAGGPSQSMLEYLTSHGWVETGDDSSSDCESFDAGPFMESYAGEWDAAGPLCETCAIADVGLDDQACWGAGWDAVDLCETCAGELGLDTCGGSESSSVYGLDAGNLCETCAGELGLDTCGGASWDAGNLCETCAGELGLDTCVGSEAGDLCEPSAGDLGLTTEGGDDCATDAGSVVSDLLGGTDVGESKPCEVDAGPDVAEEML
jgi:hypothetical protein